MENKSSIMRLVLIMTTRGTEKYTNSHMKTISVHFTISLVFFINFFIYTLSKIIIRRDKIIPISKKGFSENIWANIYCNILMIKKT